MKKAEESTINRDNKSAGHRDMPKRQVVLTMAGIMLAMFLSSLDQTIVGTAIPRIVVDLGGFTQYTWVVTAYMIAATVTVLIAGKLSDIYGRKWFLVVGIVIFLAGSAMCGASQDMAQLIGFRAFQGIGAGAIMGLAFITIGDLFPPSERGKYAGFMSAVFGLSSVIGPTLGGFITDNLSWRWVFYINIPFGILIILLFIFFFPHVRPQVTKRRIDYAGMLALILTVVPLLLALSWAGVEYDWLSPQILGMFVFSAFMFLAFVIIESYAAEPILPLWIFRNRIVGVSSIVTFFLGFGMFASIVFIPLYFQGVLGSSATASGSFLTPMMLGMVAGGVISGQMLSRAGGHYRWQGLFGIGVMAAGMYLLSCMTTGTTHATAVFFIIITGFGLGVTMPVYTIAVQNAVPYRIMGVATASNQFFRSIGGVLGLAVAGSILNNRFASEFLGGLPQGVESVMPPGSLDSIVDNPQALVSPEALEELTKAFQSLGDQGMALLDQLMTTLREALNSGITEVFFVGFCVVGAAFVVNFFIKEIPLRKHL
ncbi:MAG: MDR family MFS transporter [Dehalococcoidia bacterium]